MSLRDKQVYESNLLAFKFSLIVQFFELLSTIVYQAGRVGIMNTVAMMIMQAIVLAATIVGYIKFRSSASGKYFNMICMLVGYTIVMVGSVHVPYLWAFGAALLILSLLYGDTKLTIITSVAVTALNFIFIPLYLMWAEDPAARINQVYTDAVYALLLSLMAIFYTRLNSKQSAETLEEIQRNRQRLHFLFYPLPDNLRATLA